MSREELRQLESRFLEAEETARLGKDQGLHLQRVLETKDETIRDLTGKLEQRSLGAPPAITCCTLP